MNRDFKVLSKNKIASAVLLLLGYGWIEIYKSDLFPSLDKKTINYWVIFLLVALSFVVMAKGFYSIIKNKGESPVLGQNVNQEKQAMRWPFKIMFVIVAAFLLLSLLAMMVTYYVTVLR